jgi:hypothetical protein
VTLPPLFEHFCAFLLVDRWLEDFPVFLIDFFQFIKVRPDFNSEPSSDCSTQACCLAHCLFNNQYLFKKKNLQLNPYRAINRDPNDIALRLVFAGYFPIPY